MAEVVVERQRDPASADISAEVKRSVERSVQTIIDLIRGAVDRYVQTREEVKTEIENRGTISENDEDGDIDELSKEDRNAQQRMRDALVRAQATPIHSLVVQVEGPLFQDGERVRTKYNDHVSPPVVPVRALPTQRVRGGRGRSGGRWSPDRTMDRQAIISGLQQEVAGRTEAAAQRVRGSRGGGGRGGGRSGPRRTMDRQAIISGLRQEVMDRAEAAAQRHRANF
ncbi:unnamed protein product [Phytophthora fragariaefolia]|uniref:Unnamed protein product n=1 Tax=Phytophthora fragariaefolia TaxID=1490495 RepID=A0A9W6Y8H4_9STRA|nr:unnamed protein product [Phytophthora fragariaefolia]